MSDTHYHAFAAKYGVTSTVEEADENEFRVGQELPDCSHWLVTLHGPEGDVEDIQFTTGSAWTEPPSAGDVLTCLRSDVQSNDEFFGNLADYCFIAGIPVPDEEEWPESYAEVKERYDSVCAEQARLNEQLQAMLGDRFEEFLDDEDGD